MIRAKRNPNLAFQFQISWWTETYYLGWKLFLDILFCKVHNGKPSNCKWLLTRLCSFWHPYSSKFLDIPSESFLHFLCTCRVPVKGCLLITHHSCKSDSFYLTARAENAIASVSPQISKLSLACLQAQNTLTSILLEYLVWAHLKFVALFSRDCYCPQRSHHEHSHHLQVHWNHLNFWKALFHYCKRLFSRANQLALEVILLWMIGTVRQRMVNGWKTSLLGAFSWDLRFWVCLG